jgi:nicotinamide-nucleotide amidase
MAESAFPTSSPDPAPARHGEAQRPLARAVTVGDELLAGDIRDTNLAFLGQRCRALGLPLQGSETARDRGPEITAAVRRAAGSADVCLVCGGLGPTTDDLTTAAVADAAGVGLRRDAEAEARLEAKFRAFGREMPEANRKQADFPEGAEILPNPIGTAEGFAVDVRVGAGSCRVFVMPGVPREMEKMMREQIEPRLAQGLAQRALLRPVARRIYRILGHGESAVAQRIEPVLARARERSPRLAAMYVHYRASMPEVTVILEGLPAPAGDAASEAELATLDPEMIDALSPGIYGIGEADLATRVVASAVAGGVWIGAAESCTGGALGAAITSVAGASACLRGVVVAYDDAIKARVLGVPSDLLAAHGAVSEPVARAMATGGSRVLGSDLCVAITGIAGPGGGSPEKPVGTVHVAVADGPEIVHKVLSLRGDRGTVQRSATRWALKLLWDRLVARGVASIA